MGMHNRIDRKLIFPQHVADFKYQIINCIAQIDSLIGESSYKLAQQSFFIDAPSNEVYIEYSDFIFRELNKGKSELPSTSVIAQTPADGYKVSVELILLTDKSTDLEISYKEANGVRYTVLKSASRKEVYAGGITARMLFDPIVDQVEIAYKYLRDILTREGMDFSDIARQWNYVEEILDFHDVGHDHLQNYQILNDVRSKYYAESNFRNGYPAATGIGMNSGGLILEIYAIAPADQLSIVPLKNPKQIDAYHYSEKVLVGDTIKKGHKKTTPKFERAKYVGDYSMGTVYISGTASIQNEVTIGVNDVKLQVKITLENIANLIGHDNFTNAGLNTLEKEPDYQFIRIYVKYKEDVEKVRELCNGYYGNIPMHYLIADICRDNLLIEIEGIATVN
jgi:enamine deaminase RidA (YjgF/YER057c/UK114 family)